MICCTEPVLTEALYILYIHKTCVTCKMQIKLNFDNGLNTVTVTKKRQTRPLVREGAPQRQHSNFQTESNIWSQVPELTRHQDILTVSRNMTD
jgi:hypothetical protein